MLKTRNRYFRMVPSNYGLKGCPVQFLLFHVSSPPPVVRVIAPPLCRPSCMSLPPTESYNEPIGIPLRQNRHQDSPPDRRRSPLVSIFKKGCFGRGAECACVPSLGPLIAFFKGWQGLRPR